MLVTSAGRRLLNENQITRYHEDGFVIPDFRLSEQTLDDIRATHERLVRRHPKFVDYCPAVLGYDLGFLNFARNPEILDMVAQVIGGDIAIWNSSFFAKPARGGRKTPWHQDGQYWAMRPIATCSVWMAIDDSTKENGCLRVIRGSHREKKLRRHKINNSPDLSLNQELPPAEFDETRAVDLEMEAGQISLHDVFLVHGSEANHSERPRRGMTLRYMPTTSHYDRRIEQEQFEQFGGGLENAAHSLFLMRGVDRCRRNDYVVKG